MAAGKAAFWKHIGIREKRGGVRYRNNLCLLQDLNMMFIPIIVSMSPTLKVTTVPSCSHTKLGKTIPRILCWSSKRAECWHRTISHGSGIGGMREYNERRKEGQRKRDISGQIPNLFFYFFSAEIAVLNNPSRQMPT